MHFTHQTDPQSYIIRLEDKLNSIGQPDLTPSKRVVRALRTVRSDIATHGFRKNVLDAIFQDGYASDYLDEDYRERLLQRLIRWFGKKKARRMLVAGCEILDSWSNRDSRFVPDAYLIDSENKTVVCYEIEDSHHLNPFSIREYGAAWWTLEYIFWDLHLIAYDIYGNPRIIEFPRSEFLASEVCKVRNPPSA